MTELTMQDVAGNTVRVGDAVEVPSSGVVGKIHRFGPFDSGSMAMTAYVNDGAYTQRVSPFDFVRINLGRGAECRAPQNKKDQTDAD